MRGTQRVNCPTQQRRANRLAFAGVAFGALVCTALPAWAEAGRVIRADRWVTPEGAIQPNALVVIQDGVITQIGGEPPVKLAVDDYSPAVLCPGLIDIQAALGVQGGLSERRSAIQPELTAADAFNRFTSQRAAALAAGVTTFAIMPDNQNIIGGQIAVCQTTGNSGVLEAAGPMKLSISPAAFKVDREPTSREGALGLLRETLNTARRTPAEHPLLARLLAGERTGVLAAPTGADVLTATQLADEYGLRLVLIHEHDARQVAALATERVEGVIVGPLDYLSSPRDARGAGQFAAAGVPVAIAGGLPYESADSLRIGANVAVGAGLSPEAARSAITSVPARLLGVNDRVGAIAEGRLADLVLFTGDPLDLRSRVLAVYVAGRRVYPAEPRRVSGGVSR